ncbi:flavin reductase family protein [Streptomyces sp. NPDC048332]|uniref:flavin reductase family protein n=1 Tax=unclassified Streptomyces TaxID=2593676 RepID=UPI00341EC9F0
MDGASSPGLRESTVDDTSCRAYFRKLAAGVAVVTACGDSGWSGTTVSTLTSVSLSPPIVLCCVSHGSRTVAAIRHAGRFAVHLLSGDQPYLADRFSRPPSDSSRFEDLGHEVGLIRGAPAIAGTLSIGWCDLHSLDVVGDHVVVYGRLTALRVGEGEPLLWHDRSYRTFREPAGLIQEPAGPISSAARAGSSPLCDRGVRR